VRPPLERRKAHQSFLSFSDLKTSSNPRQGPRRKKKGKADLPPLPRPKRRFSRAITSTRRKEPAASTGGKKGGEAVDVWATGYVVLLSDHPLYDLVPLWGGGGGGGESSGLKDFQGG